MYISRWFCVVLLVVGTSLSAEVTKIVVTNYSFGYHHADGMPLTVEMLKKIGEEEDFEVSVIASDGDFTADVLEGAQVLVLQNLTKPINMNPESKQAITEWVENGGGLLTTHATLDDGEWDWLQNNCIYGHYEQHSSPGIPAEVLVDPEAYDEVQNLHPVLEGIEDLDGNMGLEIDMANGTINGWKEEWFNWNNYFRGAPNLRILLSMNLDSYDCNCESFIPEDHPALWITEPSEPHGPMAYFLVGHGTQIHKCQVDEYINNGGANCDPLMKRLHKNLVLYLGGELGPVAGCMDPLASNWTIEATVDDGSCSYSGCMVETNSQYFCTLHPDAYPCLESNGYTMANITPVPDACADNIKGWAMSHSAIQMGKDGKVSISFPHSYSVKFLNVNGEVVFGESASGTQDYSLTGYEPGIYFVKVQDASGEVTKRVFVK